jgi:hypothetical protein
MRRPGGLTEPGRTSFKQPFPVPHLSRPAFAARPPAGMLGPNLASRDAPRSVPRSPQRLLTTADRRSGPRQTLSPAKSAPRSGLSLPHSGDSFAEPPLRVRRSWPASSAPRRTGLEPVRLPAPLPGSVFRIRGGSSPATRCPNHLSGAPNGSSSLAPLRDF